MPLFAGSSDSLAVTSPSVPGACASNRRQLPIRVMAMYCQMLSVPYGLCLMAYALSPIPYCPMPNGLHLMTCQVRSVRKRYEDSERENAELRRELEQYKKMGKLMPVQTFLASWGAPNQTNLKDHLSTQPVDSSGQVL